MSKHPHRASRLKWHSQKVLHFHHLPKPLPRRSWQSRSRNLRSGGTSESDEWRPFFGMGYRSEAKVGVGASCSRKATSGCGSTKIPWHDARLRQPSGTRSRGRGTEVRGRKGSRTEWSVYYRASERCWVLKYHDAKGKRRETRLPREVVSSPDDEAGAQRAAKKWLKAYSSAAAEVQSDPAADEAASIEAPTVAELGEKWLGMRKEKYKAKTISYAALQTG